MGAYAGAEHQIKEMNSVYVVTNQVWTELPECLGTQRIKRGQRQISSLRGGIPVSLAGSLSDMKLDSHHNTIPL